MEGHAKNRVEGYCELANKKTEQLCKVSTPRLNDHNFQKAELETVGEFSNVCSHIVLKCLYLARIGRLDIPWSVNELARSVTKWKRAYDRRQARLISDIRHTNDYRQYFHVGNTAQHCRLGVFQDSDFPGELEDSKSTSGGILCIFGGRTFVPTSWMCKKQTTVSHSSTGSEIISLDACLRMDGLPAHSSNDRKSPTQGAAGNCLRNINTKLKKKGNQNVDQLSDLDHVATNASSSQCEAQLKIFEDNEAVIKMIIKGRSPNDETRVQNPQSRVRLVV